MKDDINLLSIDIIWFYILDQIDYVKMSIFKLLFQFFVNYILLHTIKMHVLLYLNLQLASNWMAKYLFCFSLYSSRLFSMA